VRLHHRAQALGVERERCVGIARTPHDITAIAGVGMCTIGIVVHPADGAALGVAGADCLYTSFDVVTAAGLTDACWHARTAGRSNVGVRRHWSRSTTTDRRQEDPNHVR
jgi:hypothetical protein